jgi:creatinine amidohydrolase
VNTTEEVRYSYLRPSQFRERIAKKPIAYLPLGTLEWHGEHLPLGADSIQSEALMIAAARSYGGIVLPPLFLGPDRRTEINSGNYLVGMDTAKSTEPHQQLTGSAYWTSYDFFKQLLEQILEQLRRAGFKAVFADGHGPSRRTWREMMPTWENQFSLQLFGVTEAMISSWEYMTDHAARNETSITKYIEPSMVDLSIFEKGVESPLLGVNGEHPFLADANYGEQVFKKALSAIGSLVQEI